MKIPDKWTDDAVLAEGRKYGSRSEFKTGSQFAYVIARKRNLLDQLYPSKNKTWTDEALFAESRKYKSRSEFHYGSPGASFAARARNLLDQMYPSKKKTWTDAELLTQAREYGSRAELERKAKSLYQRLYRRGLLNQLWSSTMRDWSKDEDVLAEGAKYRCRTDFAIGAIGAYVVARKRGLLDRISFPEGRANSRDNDAIYIWRAVGQHYNGHPVYKIGVTSARLGTRRIEQVAKGSGFEFDLICCELVQCKATDLERKLHLLGEDPQFTGFDGCTEFRALSDSALYAAISMICNQL